MWRSRQHDRFAALRKPLERWHEEAARSCEAAGLWAEAVGHLEVLQQLKPASAPLWVRQANVWARGRHWRLRAAVLRERPRVSQSPSP